jgi:hypothetical protein
MEEDPKEEKVDTQQGHLLLFLLRLFMLSLVEQAGLEVFPLTLTEDTMEEDLVQTRVEPPEALVEEPHILLLQQAY